MLCWIYPEKTDGPIFHYGTTTRWGIHFWTVIDGKLFVRFVKRGYNYRTPHLLTAQPLALNQWHYVGASYDYNSGIARLWVNGQQVVEQNIGADTPLASQDHVRMGASEVDTSRFFKGRITAMQVYNVALTAEQINAIKSAGQGNHSEPFNFNFSHVHLFKSASILNSILF